MLHSCRFACYRKLNGSKCEYATFSESVELGPVLSFRGAGRPLAPRFIVAAKKTGRGPCGRAGYFLVREFFGATFPALATRGGREASLCVGVSRRTAIRTRMISLTVGCYSVRARKHIRYVVNIVCLMAGKVLVISVLEKGIKAYMKTGVNFWKEFPAWIVCMVILKEKESFVHSDLCVDSCRSITSEHHAYRFSNTFASCWQITLTSTCV